MPPSVSTHCWRMRTRALPGGPSSSSQSHPASSATPSRSSLVWSEPLRPPAACQRWTRWSNRAVKICQTQPVSRPWFAECCDRRSINFAIDNKRNSHTLEGIHLRSPDRSRHPSSKHGTSRDAGAAVRPGPSNEVAGQRHACRHARPDRGPQQDRDENADAGVPDDRRSDERDASGRRMSSERVTSRPHRYSMFVCL